VRQIVSLPVDLRESAEDRSFRDEVRTFLDDSLRGDFGVVRGRGGPGDEHALFGERLAWERHLGAHGWTCVGWPKEHGGRGLTRSTPARGAPAAWASSARACSGRR
jgi:alkylation response protein AidB-like acyl-CoA dehydrogenase